MRRRASLVAFAALCAGFLLVLLHIMNLRLASGDVYPPYSSLRADPLGMRALFESLARQPGLKVERNFRSLSAMKPDSTAELIVAGIEARGGFDPDDLDSIDSFVRDGGQLVVAFLPRNVRPDDTKVFSLFGDTEIDRPDTGRTNWERFQRRGLRNWSHRETMPVVWQVRFRDSYVERMETTPVARLVDMAMRPAMPLGLRAKISLWFETRDTAWRVVYARGGPGETLPVWITHPLGRGTITLTALSHFLSNEALLRDRHPDLLAALFSARSRIIFDESHNGIVEEGGVMQLARRYGLTGLIAGLLVLAILYAWKSASSLVPARDDAAEAGIAAAPGRDAGAALVNLLRRNLPPSGLIEAMRAEWEKSRGARTLDAKWAELFDAALAEFKAAPRARRHPVSVYNALVKIISERKTHAR